MARQRQSGAAAIEFALLFLLFFVLFYALVSYSLAMLLRESFQHAAEEGARAAIAVDALAYADDAAYLGEGVTPRVRTTVGNALAWLPTQVKTHVLGADNGNVQVTMVNKLLTVRVIYSGYGSAPLLPKLTFPAIGDVPKLPEDLAGSAVLQL